MALKPNHRATFCRKRRLQKCTQLPAMANLAKTPKSAIFWNFAKGGPREKRPKSRPTWRAWKTPRRKWRYPLISMALKPNQRATFCRKRRLQKCTQLPAMANLAKTPKSAIFWNFAKGGPREKRPKSRPTWRAWKTPRRKWRYPLISMALKPNHRATFCRKRRLQKCTQLPAMANLAKTPKSAIFWNFAKGGPREKRPKSRPTWRAWKTPRRKWRYPLISMALKPNHRATFCRKRRLQKCTQLPAMANLAKTPKSAIFWNFAKGGPREKRPKSRPTWRAWKIPRRKWRYPLISMALKPNYRATFCRKRRLQKCTQLPAMANLAKTPKSAIFWNFAKGGPREKRPKSRPTWRAWKTPRRKWRYPLISMDLKPNHRATFCRKRRLQKCSNSQQWQIKQRHLNRPFFEILQRGDQGKNAQKVGRLDGLEKHLGANGAIP